ncbi:hypothetical protein ACK1YF_003894 [Salmonella enterica]|nr:hypothetical protein [Salmonella enterica]EJF5921634.1 hypothetical protein [Salmonella enterica]EJF5944286.1 hypothetical protein [Salmonella enterica]EKS4807686.1 hypothetical protein [Salmonella enterica]EKT1297328.1 hypothetical protein [Salmonella enterica]
MVETSPNKDSVKEKAYDFLSSKKITVQLDSYSEKTENIVGIDYRVISFCQNTKTIDVVIDHDEDSSLILKTEFIKTKTLKHFLTVNHFIILYNYHYNFLYSPIFMGR